MLCILRCISQILYIVVDAMFIYLAMLIAFFRMRLTQSFETGRPTFYLVLHQIGFILPRPLLTMRWSLTPPFHPCHANGGLFSVTLAVQDVCHLAPYFRKESCPVVSGLSSLSR